MEKQTIWYKGFSGGLYCQEELKLIWFDENPKEKFEFCNFLGWLDKKGFERA